MAGEEKRGPAWAWYAAQCIAWWGLWGFLAKVGSEKATPFQLQMLFTFGMVPVSLAILWRMKWKVASNWKGVSFGILSGVTTGIGILGYYAAMKGEAVAIVTPATGIFPLLTVMLATLLLGERLNRVQMCGIGLALLSIFILSL
jgi:transporter family protein